MANQIINKNYNLNDAIIRQAERIKSEGKNQLPNVQPGSGKSFQEILNEKIKGELTFSKHASIRSEERNLNMSPTEMTKLNEACDKATQKGIKDALIIMDKAAFIVNTSNKMIVTVVDKNEMKENVFTKIDGAVFI